MLAVLMLYFQNRAPPACTNLQYFPIVFFKLSRKTIIYLLHVCWPMPICCKVKRKRQKKGNKEHKTKNEQKTKKQKKNKNKKPGKTKKQKIK